jgi:hypothetical protein
VDSSLLKQFSSFLYREKTRFNQRITVFAFFLAISTILWYLNKLNSDYTTVVDYPVTFTNIPRNQILVGSPPKSISLKVSGFGYSILRFRLAAPLSPIIINLSQLAMHSQSESDSKKFIITSMTRGMVSSQLSSDIQLVSVSPDTLFMEFTSLITKKVKVIPNVSFTFEKQHMQSGTLTIAPDSVTISGPASVIDTINSVQTHGLNLSKLSSTATHNLNLLPIKQIGFSHRKVSIEIPIDKYTEMELEVPIHVENIPSGTNLILLPNFIKLRCNVPMGMVYATKPKDFLVATNYISSQMHSGNKLRVDLLKYPSYLRVVDFEPKFVEFYIEKR